MQSDFRWCSEVMRAMKMNPPNLVLVVGGSRSGKSSFAEEMARLLDSDARNQSGTGQPGADPEKSVLYIATASASDGEMRRRILLHQSRRPDHWATLEEPLRVEERLRSLENGFTVVILDCLTTFAANWFFHELGPAADGLPTDRALSPEEVDLTQKAMDAALDQVARLTSVLRESDGTSIVVSNEVGQGLVPPTPLGRLYRDLLGLANQLVGAAADEVFLTVAGIPTRIKPSPYILGEGGADHGTHG